MCVSTLLQLVCIQASYSLDESIHYDCLSGPMVAADAWRSCTLRASFTAFTITLSEAQHRQSLILKLLTSSFLPAGPSCVDD